jgi:DNA-damage-inducible protein J
MECHDREYGGKGSHRQADQEGGGGSDAFRLLMVRVAREKALPFEPLVPNDETVETMKAARRGELVTVGNPENLRNRLNADD